MATTPWPTWTAKVKASPSLSLKSSPPPSARPTLRLSLTTKTTTSLLPRASGTSVREEKRVGGQLGRPSGARFRTYTRLKAYGDAIKGQLFDVDALHKVIDDIYRYPLRPSAVDTLNRQLRSGVSDDQLAEIVMSLREEDRLCLTGDAAAENQEPQIICSLGLFDTEDDS